MLARSVRNEIRGILEETDLESKLERTASLAERPAGGLRLPPRGGRRLGGIPRCSGCLSSRLAPYRGGGSGPRPPCHEEIE